MKIRQELDALILCVPSRGGHIEHAFDLALALSRLDYYRNVTILTRVGAREYLGVDIDTQVTILEKLPSMPLCGSQVRQSLQVVISALRERREIRLTLDKMLPQTTLILEEARYPSPDALRPKWSRGETVLILHNVLDHEGDKDNSVRSRILSYFATKCVARVDRIIVHGARQLETLRLRTNTPAEAVDLPENTALLTGPTPKKDHLPADSPTFLCIGAVRRNKGIETAILAAELDLPLRIIGEAVDVKYFDALAKSLQENSLVHLEDRFLSREEFDAEIAQAKAVILPYRQFDAQSGILAKAKAAGAIIILSNLPALVEQVGTYEMSCTFEAGDSTSLRRVMCELRVEMKNENSLQRPHTKSAVCAPATTILGDNEWLKYASRVAGK